MNRYVESPHLGAVTGVTRYVTVVPVITTSAYTSGDLLFDATKLPNIGRISGSPLTVQSVMVVNKDDESFEAELYFTDDSTTWGTVNNAAAQADTVSDGIQGYVEIASDDWKDVGGATVVNKKGVGMVCQCAGADLYVAAIVRGTPNFAAATDLIVKVGAYID